MSEDTSADDEPSHEEYDEPSRGEPPSPPPAPPSWARPEDPTPGGTGWSDVMEELQMRNPENSGRWSASTAAGFDNDNAFFDETGIRTAQDAYTAAAQAMGQSDTYSIDQYSDAVSARADAEHAVIDVDTGRNRYQQTTDYQPAMSGAEQHGYLDESTAMQLAAAQADPASAGIGMTTDQQLARKDALEFTARTGVETGGELTPDQQAQQQSLREAEAAQQAQAQTEFLATADGQEYLRRQEIARGELDRAAASEARSQERSGRHGGFSQEPPDPLRTI